MKEPTEVINRATFHVGQQFGTKVKLTVDRIKDMAKMDWHIHGIKITYNGVTRVCSISTVHGIDVENESLAPPLVVRRPGRPPTREIECLG